jgi:predicted nucleic acid-binding protein
VRLAAALSGVTKLGLDSSVFIAFAEAAPASMRVLTRIFERVQSGKIQGITTTVTMTEVLTYAKQVGDALIEEKYRAWLSFLLR